jgi:hypothetical protein
VYSPISRVVAYSLPKANQQKEEKMDMNMKNP